MSPKPTVGLLALLATSSAAQNLTTSVWMPTFQQPLELRYYGSVIDFDPSLSATTLALTYTPDSETSLLDPYSRLVSTYTVGPNFIATSTANIRPYTFSSANHDQAFDSSFSMGCTKPTDSPESSLALPTCTYAYGRNIILGQACGELARWGWNKGWTTTNVITYSKDTASPSAVQTVVRTIGNYDSATRPSWCGTATRLDRSAVAQITVPSEALTRTTVLSQWAVASYEVVLTAGLEKLSATATGTPSGTQGNGEGEGGVQQGGSGTGAGAAGPRITAAPMVLGLGALVGAMVL